MRRNTLSLGLLLSILVVPSAAWAQPDCDFPEPGPMTMESKIKLLLFVDGTLVEGTLFDSTLTVELFEPFTNSQGFRQQDFKVTAWDAVGFSDFVGRNITFVASPGVPQPLSTVVAQTTACDFPAALTFRAIYDADIEGLTMLTQLDGTAAGIVNTLPPGEADLSVLKSFSFSDGGLDLTFHGGLCAFDVSTACDAVVANTAPAVTISAPADGSTLQEGEAVTFLGTAWDNEEGDLSTNIHWTSDLDGTLGTGLAVTAILSRGVHTITATVIDSGGLPGSTTITVSQCAFPPSGPMTMTSKIKLPLFADGSLVEEPLFDSTITVELFPPFTNTQGFRQQNFEVTSWNATGFSAFVGRNITFAESPGTTQPIGTVIAQTATCDFPAALTFRVTYDATIEGLTTLFQLDGTAGGVVNALPPGEANLTVLKAFSFNDGGTDFEFRGGQCAYNTVSACAATAAQ